MDILHQNIPVLSIFNIFWFDVGYFLPYLNSETVQFDTFEKHLKTNDHEYTHL